MCCIVFSMFNVCMCYIVVYMCCIVFNVLIVEYMYVTKLQDKYLTIFSDSYTSLFIITVLLHTSNFVAHNCGLLLYCLKILMPGYQMRTLFSKHGRYIPKKG